MYDRDGGECEDPNLRAKSMWSLDRHNIWQQGLAIVQFRNCKTEKQSQASLCRRPKLVSNLVQASRNPTQLKNSKDASTSVSVFFIFFSFGAAFFFFTFSAPLCLLLFSFSFFYMTESAARDKLQPEIELQSFCTGNCCTRQINTLQYANRFSALSKLTAGNKLAAALQNK